MTWKRCKALIASDLWRHTGTLGVATFWGAVPSVPGFRYAYLLRFYAYACTAAWCQIGVRQL